MPDLPLGPRPVFRPSPADHAHAAAIAARLRANGADATPTTILRAALMLAAVAQPASQEAGPNQ